MGLFSTSKSVQYRSGGLGQIQPTRTNAHAAKSDFKQTAIIAALAFMLVGSLSYIAMQSVNSNSAGVQSQNATADTAIQVASLAPASPPKPLYPEIKAYAPQQEERAFLSDNGAIDVLQPEQEPFFVFTTAQEPAATAPDCVVELRQPAREATFFFGVGSAEFQSADLARLAAFTQKVIDCPEAMVHVTGHSDTSGNDLTNLDLSWKRADSTVNAIIALGLESAQFEPVGFGARSPLSQGDTSDEDRNRRVEFHVLHRETDH